MKNERSAFVCETCVHSDVCKYKEKFEKVVESVLSAKVMVSEEPITIKPISSYDWVKISVDCKKCQPRNMPLLR
jgi:phage terminase large subunit